MIWWAILLFACGIILILAEFLLPGAICGVVGAILLIGAGVLAVQSFPDMALFIVVGEVAAVAVSITLGFFLISKTSIGKGLKLSSTQDAEDGYVNVETNAALMGAMGKVRTALRPAGTVIIHGERLDAVSNGAFIDEDKMVQVIEVRGNRIVVEEAESM
jgi:membrane-bound serine protease (ClpP class)